MERQEYLQFFLNNKKKPSSKTIYNHHDSPKQSKSLHLHGHKIDKKLLPHISEEYQYKITNQLLVNKIMNPKRDKLIVQNFQKSISRPATRQTKSRGQTIVKNFKKVRSLDRKNIASPFAETGSMSLYSRLKVRQNLTKIHQKGIKGYQKSFHLALQNDRMGRRIINTKSSVEQILKKTFYTYKSNSKSKDCDKQNCGPDLKNSFIRGKQNKKYYFTGKINNGVKVFFNKIRDDSKEEVRNSRSLTQSKIMEPENANQNNLTLDNIQNAQNSKIQNPFQERKRQVKTSANFRNNLTSDQLEQIQQSKHFETHYPESFKVFGKGPTILMIYDLEITCNPTFKQSSMMLFELITHEKRINFRKNRQKSIRTVPICYNFFKPLSNQQLSNCIRFAINVSQIGDFVPLRLYRVHGVQLQQLGIIDIDLSPFRYRKSQLTQIQLNQKNNEIFSKQYKLNGRGQKLERDLISGNIEGNLRKNLLNKPVEIFVKLSYKIYPKRFKNVSSVSMNQS